MLIYFDCFNDIIGYPSQLAALKVSVSRPLHNNPNTSSMLKKEALWSRRGNYKTQWFLSSSVDIFEIRNSIVSKDRADIEIILMKLLSLLCTLSRQDSYCQFSLFKFNFVFQACIQSKFYKQHQLEMYYFICPSFLNMPTISWPNPVFESLDKKTSDYSDTAMENKNLFSPTVLQNPQTPTVWEELPQIEPVHRLKLQKVTPSEKQKEQDDDYNPYCQIAKKGKKSKQLLNRNVVPNIIRLVLSFIQKPGKSSKLVEKSLRKQGCEAASVHRFFHFQKLVKGKMDNYVNIETLRELSRLRPDNFEVYSRQEQICYRKITRKLATFFLQHEALSCVLTSKRMEQAKKREHVAAIRSIIDRLKIAFVQSIYE